MTASPITPGPGASASDRSSRTEARRAGTGGTNAGGTDTDRTTADGAETGRAEVGREGPRRTLPAAPSVLRRIGGWLPVQLAGLTVAAHFLRDGRPGLTAFWILVPLLAWVPRRWALRGLQVLLVLGAGLWLDTALDLVAMRSAVGAPWVRAAGILGGVAALTLLAAWGLGRPGLRGAFRTVGVPWVPSLAAFGLTVGGLAIVLLVPSRSLMLVDRFLPGAGWVVALLLAVYAGFVAEKMLSPRTQSKWRRRIWGLFSFAFFAQLLIGLAGVEQFLMTGELHYPVPALVAAGPLYRGGGLFMLALFGTTVLLVGPAWCSHLCYIGAWDSAMAHRLRRPKELPKWRHAARVSLLVLVFGTAFGLGRLGASPALAGGLAAGFGVAGVGLMAWWSRKTGVMAHCTTWCPTGVLANALGRINPFRMRIREGCTDCMACSLGCRYDALRPEDVARRRPGFSCTLCGDCVGRCPRSVMEYSFPGLSPTAARGAFIALVSALHAVFLGVAMI